MVRMRVALLGLAVSACANLPDVPAGTCGNGVIDVGEDCDGGAHCSQCSITCDTSACPDGYACGVDQLCHAPSGVFHGVATSSFGFPVFTGLPADVNGDGIDDVVGVSTASIVVTYGEPHGLLTDQATQVTPAHGQFAFANRAFGTGGASELLFGTPDGIAGF